MQDEFYDLCDQLGLLVWEEFMFACSMYADGKDFKNNVASEVCARHHRGPRLHTGVNSMGMTWTACVCCARSLTTCSAS